MAGTNICPWWKGKNQTIPSQLQSFYTLNLVFSQRFWPVESSKIYLHLRLLLVTHSDPSHLSNHSCSIFPSRSSTLSVLSPGHSEIQDKELLSGLTGSVPRTPAKWLQAYKMESDPSPEILICFSQAVMWKIRQICFWLLCSRVG